MVQSTALYPLGPVSNPENLAMDKAEAAFDELADWLLSAAALEMPCHKVEAEHAARGREVLRQMLEAHIRARGDGRVGPAIVKTTWDRDGHSKEVDFVQARPHSRQMKTIFGSVTVIRIGYSAPGEDSLHPLDAMLPFPARSFSYELQRRFTKQAVQVPLDAAIATIKENTGVTLSKGSAEAVITEAAQHFDQFYDAEPKISAQETGPILVAETDGKGVPMIKPPGTQTLVHRKKGDKKNKKKMATLGAVYTKQPHVRTPEEVVESLFRPKPPVELVKPKRSSESAQKKRRQRPENKRIWASLKKSKDEVIQEIAQECQRRDPEQTKTRVALTDGEIALQQRVLRLLLGFMLILDFLHVMQRLWKAAHVFYKEGSREAEDWVKDRALRLLQGDVDGVVRGLRISAAKRKLKGELLKKVEASAAYLERNRDYMAYDQYLAQGLPIATGNVEGAAKNLVKDRMEGSGMRWSLDGGEAMLKLRALHLCGDFDEYWDYHIDQERREIYPLGLSTLMSEN